MARVFDPAHSRVIIRGDQDAPTQAGMEYLIAIADLNEGYKVATLGAPEFELPFEEFWQATIRDIREAEEMDPPNWQEDPQQPPAEQELDFTAEL